MPRITLAFLSFALFSLPAFSGEVSRTKDRNAIPYACNEYAQEFFCYPSEWKSGAPVTHQAGQAMGQEDFYFKGNFTQHEKSPTGWAVVEVWSLARRDGLYDGSAGSFERIRDRHCYNEDTPDRRASCSSLGTVKANGIVYNLFDFSDSGHPGRRAIYAFFFNGQRPYYMAFYCRTEESKRFKPYFDIFLNSFKFKKPAVRKKKR